VEGSGGQVRTRAIEVQHKTGRPVEFDLRGDARASLPAWLERRGSKLDDCAFPSRINHADTAVRQKQTGHRDDLFEGRRQLIIYRAFFEPGVFGWPDHACRGCSMVADQVAHVAHLNARDTTLVFASRAPQADIVRLKARMGWKLPWVTITDSFDVDFGVDDWHGTNVFYRDGDQVFRTYFINNRGDEQMGGTWNYLDITPLGRQEVWENSPDGYPQTPPYKWWNWHDNYVADAAPDKKWVRVSEAGEAAFRKETSSTTS
jgi:predicted dithiol-disulfide oxidoreductase (DUF899 family)